MNLSQELFLEIYIITEFTPPPPCTTLSYNIHLINNTIHQDIFKYVIYVMIGKSNTHDYATRHMITNSNNLQIKRTRASIQQVQ